MSEVHGSRGANGHGEPAFGWREREDRGQGELPGVEEIAERAREWEGAARHFAQAHPIPVLLGAAAAGFLLARLLRGDDR